MKIKFKKHNPKSLKQLARDNIELDDKQLNEELAKKMLNRYYFTDENLRVGFSKGDSTNYTQLLKSFTTLFLAIESTIYPRYIMKIYYYQQI